MEATFGEAAAAEAAKELAQAFRGEGGDSTGQGRASLRPISRLVLENFRSFGEEDMALPSAAVLHGANGSGKTSICEALEILWSGRTRRIPGEVGAQTYEKHLQRGKNRFHIHGHFAGGGEVDAERIEETPKAPLGRSVLPQHALAEMASGTPRDRFKAFLVASGLELPDFEQKVIDLRKTAREQADRALDRAEINGIPAVNVPAIKHLRRELEGEFSASLPGPERIEGAAEALSRASDGAFSSKLPAVASPAVVALALSDVDAALARVRDKLDKAPDPGPAVERALLALREEASGLRKLGDPLRQVARRLVLMQQPRVSSPDGDDDPIKAAPVSSHAAARWLAHVHSLQSSVFELNALEDQITERAWVRRLKDYTGALTAAIERSSADELEALAKTAPSAKGSSLPSDAELPVELLSEARFTRAPEATSTNIAAIEELCVLIEARVVALEEVIAGLKRNSAHAFAQVAPQVMPALCRFELARDLAKPTGAVARARETLVTRLLDNRLTPVVRELVQALVRFEWYFEPMNVEVKGRDIYVGGMASSDPSLDVRLMLNTAERSMFGIAWFLALHVLQDPEERKVLILDDPSGDFDAMNKPAFVATLRSLLHLLKPEQFLITTHDDAMVALLEQELATVDGWPADFGLLLCRRTAEKTSEILSEEGEVSRTAVDLDRELRMLSLERDDLPSAA